MPGPAELCRCPVLVTMGATAWGSGGDFSAGSVDGTDGDKDGGVRTDGTQSEDGGEGSSPVVTLILERTYMGLPCALFLTSVFCSGTAAGLGARPSIVLDGSSAYD